VSISLPRGLPAEAAFTGVTIDSRKVHEGDLFVALRGERFDGHDFIQDALSAGAIAAVVEQSWFDGQKKRAVKGLPLIPVTATLAALQSLALYHRRRLGLPVIGVTGSNGKTTTKEMIAAALGTRFRVLRSEGSLNNHIGVPLTLLRMRRTHEIVVAEMGMNHSGEITRLCEIAEPTAGVVTNVGTAHLEYFDDLDEIAKAKQELIEAIGPHGFVVLNGDDPRVAAMSGSTEARSITFGFSEGVNVQGEIIELINGIFPLFRYNGGSPIRLWVPGRHNVANALAAVAVALAMGCTPEEIHDGLESYRGVKWRTEVIERGGIVILNDAYNSNPVSAAAALGLLRDWSNSRSLRRVAVLGDMLELGEESGDLHARIGREAFECGVELLVAVGEHAGEIADGARAAGMSGDRILLTGTVDAAWDVLNDRITRNDLVLLKASRGVGLEQLVGRIQEKDRALTAEEGEA
jgi:UDP-N-acetylmuramoyl-tripeptide--D-alanyl-D-alanine ligase